ncbi:unnamed protein product [Somion occarium]|uniref:Fungal N-terminal domain-containing protein n=1 Tax=Somion occarium TaxID=3059160 RepID=A0ABP1E857_9APHY
MNQTNLNLLDNILHNLSTQCRIPYKQLFLLRSSINPDIASNVENFFQAYSQLLWICRDVAGDIRTAIIDFRNAILPTLENEKLPTSVKIEIIDGWMSRTQAGHAHVDKLPTQFERLAKDLRQFSQELENDNETIVPMRCSSFCVITQVTEWFSRKLRSSRYSAHRQNSHDFDAPLLDEASARPISPIATAVWAATDKSTPSGSPRKRWKAFRNVKNFLSSLKSKTHLEARRNTSDEVLEDARIIFETSKTISVLGTETKVFIDAYAQLFQIVEDVRKLLLQSHTLQKSEISGGFDSFRAALDSFAKVLETYQKLP